MKLGAIVCLGLVISLFGSGLGNKTPKTPDALASLGDITSKLVTTIVQSDDDQVDIYGMADLITAMSKAATVVENPNLFVQVSSNDLQAKVDRLRASITGLTNRQTALQATIDRQAEELRLVDRLAGELNESQAMIAQLEQAIQDKANGLDKPFVGFTAWSDVGSSYSSQETIRFPQVLFNYGQGYDQYSGEFTCPLSGVYSVNVHLEEQNSGGLIVDAILDSNAFFRVHVHDDSTEHGTTATSAMVGCLSGQRIYMRSQDSGSSAQIQYIEKRSIFSVYLIKALPNDEVIHGQLM